MIELSSMRNHYCSPPPSGADCVSQIEVPLSGHAPNETARGSLETPNAVTGPVLQRRLLPDSS
eukprot:6251715-Pyramimonas_sp.AAC.1